MKTRQGSRFRTVWRGVLCAVAVCLTVFVPAQAQILGTDGVPTCENNFQYRSNGETLICGTYSGVVIRNEDEGVFTQRGGDVIAEADVVCVSKERCDDLSNEAWQDAVEVQQAIRELQAQRRNLNQELRQLTGRELSEDGSTLEDAGLFLRNSGGEIGQIEVRLEESASLSAAQRSALENALEEARSRAITLIETIQVIDARIGTLEAQGFVPGLDDPNTSTNPVYVPNIPEYPGLGEFDNKEIFDGPGLEGGANRIRRNLDQSLSRSESLPALIVGWIRFAFPLVAIIAVVAIIYAGFLFIFYYGDDSRRETAQNIIIYVIVGIVLIFAAFAIVETFIGGIG